MAANKEIEISVRMSLQSMREGCATSGQFNILLDACDMLLLGSELVQDAGAKAVGVACKGTLFDIGTRAAMRDSSSLAATPAQYENLRLMVEVAYDFWLRQPPRIFKETSDKLRAIRVSQLKKVVKNETIEQSQNCS